ncbi:hypothetical protein KIN20_029234 [Parelaphostrongylus tenuis]|uniref:Uncharacterized protein n=1 Tax=Parelaphostrongylus tenuis TaxID=148309 RepID=A0AAD5R281_PARTN|nr:hypothetical protein KIN20_029234 [Parelaphostrongylus tenuis]
MQKSAKYPCSWYLAYTLHERSQWDHHRMSLKVNALYLVGAVRYQLARRENAAA